MCSVRTPQNRTGALVRCRHCTDFLLIGPPSFTPNCCQQNRKLQVRSEGTLGVEELLKEATGDEDPQGTRIHSSQDQVPWLEICFSKYYLKIDLGAYKIQCFLITKACFSKSVNITE